MSAPLIHEITQYLTDWRNGDQTALEKLAPLVHQELHRLAQSFMRGERTDHTLQTTALINEAYVRLIGATKLDWQNRAHFYAVAATMMRHILVDFARSREQIKRGGGLRQVSLDDSMVITPHFDAEILDLDRALCALAQLNERQTRIVELRFFGGLTEPEIAEALGISSRTVSSEWNLARAWLLRELSRDSANEP